MRSAAARSPSRTRERRPQLKAPGSASRPDPRATGPKRGLARPGRGMDGARSPCECGAPAASFVRAPRRAAPSPRAPPAPPAEPFVEPLCAGPSLRAPHRPAPSSQPGAPGTAPQASSPAGRAGTASSPTRPLAPQPLRGDSPESLRGRAPRGAVSPRPGQVRAR